MNIVLTGPMASGKTKVGKQTAKALNMTFLDTDDLIMERTRMDINQIFSEMGEEHFRKIEEEVIEVISGQDDIVVATGGGVVLSNINMKRLRKNSIIINLKASLDTLCTRLENSMDRPLLNGKDLKEELRKHSEGRIDRYKNADYFIDTDNIDISNAVDRIIHLSMQPFVRICACIAGESPTSQMKKAVELGASIVELRLDLIPDPDIPSLIRESGLPVIATDRKEKDNLITAIKAGGDFVDVEIESPERDRIIEVASQYNCKVIVSFHDYGETPEAFPEKGSADLLKIATEVNSKEDYMRLLNLINERDDIIVIGMGTLGTSTRVIAPLLGSYLTYASMGQDTGPGQISLDTMKEIYNGLGII